MVQILPPVERKASIGQRLSQGVGRGLEMGSQLLQQHQQQQQQAQQFQQENEAVKQLIGKDISGVRDPKMRQAFVDMANQAALQEQKYGFESQLAGEKTRQKAEEERFSASEKNKEKIAPFKAGLETIGEMRKLRQKGNLGIAASYSPFAETRKDAAHYEQLGKSLISLASNIPIRNQIEFQTLAEQLYDPNITDAAAEGILDAMESIISRNMGEVSSDQEEISQENKVLDSDAMQKIYQLSGGDKEKAKKIAKKMGYKV